MGHAASRPRLRYRARGRYGALDAQGVAMNEIGRRAIMADPDWRGGAYAAEGVFPTRGLSIARMVGMVTYHSKESMELRFGRNLATRPILYPAFGPTFDVEGYLHYHGEALHSDLIPIVISISRERWISMI